MLILFFGIVNVTNIRPVLDLLGYWTLILGGALGFVTTFITAATLKRALKRREEEALSGPVSAPAAEAPAFEEADAFWNDGAPQDGDPQ